MQQLTVTDLADALGAANPGELRLALDLAARIGVVRLHDDGQVELPAYAVARLGLSRDADGRWMTDGDRREGHQDREPPESDGPAYFESSVVDPRALQPWEEIAAREPPTDRISAVARWLNHWSSRRPPAGPGGEGPSESQPGPQPPRAARQPIQAPDRPTAPPPSRPPGRTEGAGPGARRSSFDLTALRATLEAPGRAAC